MEHFNAENTSAEADRPLMNEAETFDRKSLANAIGDTARSLDASTIGRLTDDEWSKRDFDAKLEVWAFDSSHSQEELDKVLVTLKEMKSLESSSAPDKNVRMKALYLQLP